VTQRKLQINKCVSNVKSPTHFRYKNICQTVTLILPAN